MPVCLRVCVVDEAALFVWPIHLAHFMDGFVEWVRGMPLAAALVPGDGDHRQQPPATWRHGAALLLATTTSSALCCLSQAGVAQPRFAVTNALLPACLCVQMPLQECVDWGAMTPCPPSCRYVAIC